MARPSILRWIFAVALIFGANARVEAQTEVDLQLVLAVDASGSVNDTRFQLQQAGYAAAFRHPRVLSAIRSGIIGSIAVTMTQWTGPSLHVVTLPWTRLHDQASVLAFADAIEKAPRDLFSGGTSISGAIDHSMKLMTSSPFKGTKRVIDVSGDGANNRGRPVTEARDDAVRTGIVINGLPILALEPYLDRYYFNNVIGGPGSFMIPAESYEKFAEAVLRKLVLEIATLDEGRRHRQRAPSPRLRGEGRGEGKSPRARSMESPPHTDRHSASKTRVNALMAVRPLPASGER